VYVAVVNVVQIVGWQSGGDSVHALADCCDFVADLIEHEDAGQLFDDLVGMS
jgi:hypothetical protein